jgi:FkbM family methyltransferase
MRYHFIDIGCGHESVSSDIYGTADNIFGMYVEPIKEYLDVLPSGKNIIKENCAIHEHSEVLEFNALIIDNPRYFSNDEMIQVVKNKQLHKDYDRKYPGSGNSTFYNINDKWQNRKKILVKTMTLEELFKKHNVTEIEYLKIDVEGCEESLLKQLHKLMTLNKVKVLNQIKFEYNYLSNLSNLNKLTELFCQDFRFTSQYETSLPWNEDMVLSSIEYRQQQIQQLYRDILKREADNSGMQHYLHSSFTLSEIKNIFKNSSEFINNTKIT